MTREKEHVYIVVQYTGDLCKIIKVFKKESHAVGCVTKHVKINNREDISYHVLDFSVQGTRRVAIKQHHRDKLLKRINNNNKLCFSRWFEYL